MDKIRGILWPFLVWSTIYCVVIDIHFSSIWELRKLYTGGSHLWFLFYIHLLSRIKAIGENKPSSSCCFSLVIVFCVTGW